QRGARGKPPGEHVRRDVDLPRRRLDHRVAVVGRVLAVATTGGLRPALVAAPRRGRMPGAHRRPPRNGAPATAGRTRAASPARLNVAGRSRVVTTGSGGSA